MNIWFRRLFVILSIGGGFAGFTVTMSQLFRAQQMLLYYVICIVACLAYLQGIVAGITLLEDEPKGTRLLFWYFVAQIPVLTSPILSYMFCSGALAYVTVGLGGMTWYAEIGGRWQFALLRFNDPSFAVGINVFALWAAWYLWKAQSAKAATALDPTPPSVTPIPSTSEDIRPDKAEEPHH